MAEFGRFIQATDEAPLLRDIQTDTIAGFLRQQRAATSMATARLFRKMLSSFFRYAADNRVLGASPVPSSRSLKLTEDDGPGRRAFTLDELKTIYNKAPSDFWRWMILAGFYLGQRMGDLICITWGAVDFDQGVIRLRARKTGRPLTIPLRAELRAFLAERMTKACALKPADPVWPGECQRYEEQGAGSFSNEFYDDVLLPANSDGPLQRLEQNLHRLSR